MIKRNGVRGTMEVVPSIEVNVDTVYVRSNIERVEEPDFSGWQYDEVQYNKDNYIEEIATENELLKEQLGTSVSVLEFHEDLMQEIVIATLK